MMRSQVLMRKARFQRNQFGFNKVPNPRQQWPDALGRKNRIHESKVRNLRDNWLWTKELKLRFNE